MPKYRPAAGGGFLVRVRGDSRGMAKAVERSRDRVTVEYFHSIAHQERLVVARSDVAGVYLSKQTRCYLYNEDEQRWEMGRVGERDGREYEVNFPDQRSLWVPEACVYVRSNAVVDDPTETLVLKGHETALFHATRLRLVRSLVSQRAASHGLSALTSARIELFPHQVEAVRRVLEDPIQRYLLADEVGLGKTIEAGVLIRQYLLDEPRGHVLVVVPPLLKEQWKQELNKRFDAFRGDRVSIVSPAELDQSLEAPVGMLVLDEAHHVATECATDESVATRQFHTLWHLVGGTERVLLLSATPAASNERQFLAMLHLLDPRIYRMEDLKQFEERVRIRQEVGRLLLTLTEDAPLFSLKLSLGRLRDLFPGDGQLLAYADQLAQRLQSDHVVTEASLALIRAIRTHVSETYRLHRRMVRSRRSAHPEAIVARSRSSVTAINDESESARQVDSLLDEWRALAAAAVRDESDKSALRAGMERLFLALVQSADGAPAFLGQVIHQRLKTATAGIAEALTRELGTETADLIASLPLFPGERDALSALSEAAQAQVPDWRRPQALLDFLKHVRDGAGRRPVPKCIVFCGFTSTASETADQLAQQFGQRAVARHLADDDPDSTEADVWRFESDRDCFVVVCDRSGEEGRNFQFAEHIVHFDLPWQPSRIEQRIGRLDRIGRTRDLQTHVFLGPHSEFSVHQAWYRFLADGLGVFRASIASLQFYTDAKLPQAVAAGFRLGAQGLAELVPVVNREIEAEQEKVAEQDAIDAIDTGDESAIRFQESLDHADVRHAELMKSVEGWLCTVLGFGKDPYTPVSGSVKYRAERSTLVPANEVRSRFGPFLDRPGTYDRSVAAKHPEVALYRPGEGLIDALAEYIEWDDRGRAFAIWRQEPTWDSREGAEWVGFRFDVLVEADTRPAKEVLAQLGEGKTSPRALDRQADALFAPMTETVFVNAALQEVTDSELLRCLRRPFSKDMDHNLTKARVSVIEAVVARDVWDTLCRQARDAALRMVRERPTLRFACEEAAALAARKLAVRMERLRLRTIQSSISDQRELLPGALKLEQDVGEALIKGIQQPRVRLDAVGFIVLSGRRPFPNNDSREAFQ